MSLAAVVCTVCTVLLLVTLVQTGRFAAQRGLSFKEGYKARWAQNAGGARRLLVAFVAVLASLLVLLLASGNIRHLLGSRALRHQPDGTYAYMVETADGKAPGIIRLESVPSKLAFEDEAGRQLTDKSKSTFLTALYLPNGTLEWEDHNEISQHGTVYLLTADGSLSARLLDEAADIEGFAPSYRRGMFYWLDIIVPVPVALYLCHLAYGIRTKRKEAN